MKCFCKKNEKKCKLNCNCHIFYNIKNEKCFVNHINNGNCSLAKYNNNVNNYKENNRISINKTIFYLKKNNRECNKSDIFGDSESSDNLSDISEDNQVNEIHIKKASSYFNK